MTQKLTTLTKINQSSDCYRDNSHTAFQIIKNVYSSY